MSRQARSLERAIAKRMIADIQAKMYQQLKYATGNAVESWVYDESKHSIVSHDPGMYFVEYGRGPSKKLPPYEAIETWVSAKYGYTGKKLQNVTWAMRKHIAQHGIKASYIVRQVLEEYAKYKGSR